MSSQPSRCIRERQQPVACILSGCYREVSRSGQDSLLTVVKRCSFAVIIQKHAHAPHPHATDPESLLLSLFKCPREVERRKSPLCLWLAVARRECGGTCGRAPCTNRSQSCRPWPCDSQPAQSFKGCRIGSWWNSMGCGSGTSDIQGRKAAAALKPGEGRKL